MADYDSQLPVRSKQDVDERVLTKIQDGDNPDGANETMTVSEKKAHVRMHGKDAGGVDRETLHSEEGHVQSNGDYDAVSNTRPSSQGLIASDRAAAPDETTMNKRPTAVAGEDDTVSLDVALRHSDGDRIDNNNPLPVYIEETGSNNTVNAFYKHAGFENHKIGKSGTRNKILILYACKHSFISRSGYNTNTGIFFIQYRVNKISPNIITIEYPVTNNYAASINPYR